MSASWEPGGRAPAVLVAAIHKSGTHLVQKLMTQLGYTPTTMDEALLDSAEGDDAQTFLGRLEPGAAYFFSGLTIRMVPPPLLRHWRASGQPPILFNYRDPRAVLLSQVNYLLGKSQGGFTETSYHMVYSDILRAQPDEAAALDVAIRTMGDYLRQSFESSQWLLFHPRACRMSYERLVGSRGGGSDAEQLRTVAAVMDHLGIRDRDPAEVAGQLYDTGQRTFFRGQADAWREVYTPDQLRAFHRRYADLLELYGYEREEP
ncbi:MAG TPA: hypothetical protein VHN15_00650 [Thermoanaerobaculia bacterium]|nr:hypothetical protein [Thermoanaerobaculia bacterium]